MAPSTHRGVDPKQLGDLVVLDTNGGNAARRQGSHSMPDFRVLDDDFFVFMI